MKRREFPRPVMRRDIEISAIERRLWNDIQRLTAISTASHITFLMNNIRTNLKQSGHWLDGHRQYAAQHEEGNSNDDGKGKVTTAATASGIRADK